MTDESIFAEALGISDPSGRAAYLDRICAGNAELRQQVEALLAAHAAGSPLDQPPESLARTGPYTPAVATVGDHVGPYKLLEAIGEGGIGEVWLAEQTEPVKRRVALKLIKPGMDTRSVLARFEAERQALALMDHPNIAKVFDAGQTADGRPYFVMELVKGTPIEFDPGKIDTADNKKLSTAAWVKVTLNGTVVFKGEILSDTAKLNGTGGQANKLPLESGTIFLQSHWGSQVEFRNPVVDEAAIITRN